MTLNGYVKMETCDSGYFQGDDTFALYAASLLQEFSSKQNTK